MTRITVELPVRIPLALCRRYVAESVRHESFLQAYAKIRNAASSSQITEQAPDRIVIQESAYDPLVKVHLSFSTGWRIIYGFTALDAERTQVEITIEYGRLLLLLSMGLAKPQAENEILHRINALLAFEQGLHAGREGAGGRLLEAASEKISPAEGPSAEGRAAGGTAAEPVRSKPA